MSDLPLVLNPNQNPLVVPNATETSAGAMSAEDKVKLDSLSPGGVPSVVEWRSSVSYALINAIIVQLGGSATVVLTPVAGSPFMIPAGDYDTRSISFLAANFQLITFAAGANIDNGGTTSVATLFGTNVGFAATAPICSPGCQVSVSLNGNATIAYNSNAASMFPDVLSFSIFQVQGGVNAGLVEANGTQPIATLSSGFLTVEFQNMSSVGPGAVFNGSGTVSLFSDQVSVAAINAQAFGTLAVDLSSLDVAVVTELRKVQSAITSNMPVMPSSAVEYDVQAWDGANPEFIVGIATGDSAAGPGDLIHVVEQSGQVATWLNDGTSAITCGVQLNFSTLVVGRVTPVGSATDSGVFATISRGTSIAFAGAPVLGTFSASGISAASSSSTSMLFFSTAAIALAITDGTVTGGGNATGAMFTPDRPIKISGATWFQPAAGLPVQLELWTFSGGGGGSWSVVATQTIPTPAQGVLNTAHFATPYIAVVGQPYAIVVYDGTNQLLFINIGGSNFSGFTQPGQGWTNGSNSAATIWGPGLWLYGFGFAAATSPALLTLNVPTYTGIDLLYSLS